MPRYPDVTVILMGQDGNAFSVLGAVCEAMRRGGVQEYEISTFRAEAMSGTYDHLLATVMEWVTVD